MSTTAELRVVPAALIARARIAIEGRPPGLTRSGWGWWPSAPLDPHSVAIAICFVEFGPCERTGEPEVSSYRLKHLCERWAKSVGYRPYYVGTLAARYLGVWMREMTRERCLLALRPQEVG